MGQAPSRPTVHSSGQGHGTAAWSAAGAGAAPAPSAPTAPPGARPAGRQPQHLVFLSHAGEQKPWVDCLHTLLTRVYRIPAFMDERSLVPGGYNAPAMMEAVGSVPLGECLVSA